MNPRHLNINWTLEQDEMLRKDFPIRGPSVELQKKMCLSRYAIKIRATQLGLIALSSVRWTERENKILIDNYQIKSCKEIMELLDNKRSIVAIQAHAGYLNISDALLWKDEELKQLKRYYEKGHWELGKPKRSDESIREKAHYLGMVLSKEAKVIVSRRAGPGRNALNGYGRVLGCMISHAIKGALVRGIDHPLLDGSLESNMYLDSLALDHCALSGLPITYKTKCHHKMTASLDRIDSLKGYIKGNVRWIHKDINKTKMNMSDDKYIYYCKHVTRYMTEKNNIDGDWII